MKESIGKIAKQLSIVASAIGAGVVAGLMLAPKSGKETRQEIKEKLEETKDSVVNKAEQIKTKVSSENKD